MLEFGVSTLEVPVPLPLKSLVSVPVGDVELVPPDWLPLFVPVPFNVPVPAGDVELVPPNWLPLLVPVPFVPPVLAGDELESVVSVRVWFRLVLEPDVSAPEAPERFWLCEPGVTLIVVFCGAGLAAGCWGTVMLTFGAGWGLAFGWVTLTLTFGVA